MIQVLVVTDTDFMFFFFKQKTAYEMRISDWSSDVCSSDLSNVLDTAPLKPSNSPARIRWPVDDTGRNSVSPSTMPSRTTTRRSLKGISSNRERKSVV